MMVKKLFMWVVVVFLGGAGIITLRQDALIGISLILTSLAFMVKEDTTNRPSK